MKSQYGLTKVTVAYVMYEGEEAVSHALLQSFCSNWSILCRSQQLFVCVCYIYHICYCTEMCDDCSTLPFLLAGLVSDFDLLPVSSALLTNNRVVW